MQLFRASVSPAHSLDLQLERQQLERVDPVTCIVVSKPATDVHTLAVQLLANFWPATPQ